MTQSISITKSILDARGNRDALLELVNDKTIGSLLEEITRMSFHLQISPQSYVSELAMSLFDSKAVTIRWEQVIFGKSVKRRYDLTRGDHAVRALKEWALMNKSLQAYRAVGEDHRAYTALLESNRKEFGKELLYSGIPTSLKLTRHRK